MGDESIDVSMVYMDVRYDLVHSWRGTRSQLNFEYREETNNALRSQALALEMNHWSRWMIHRRARRLMLLINLEIESDSCRKISKYLFKLWKLK